MTSTGSEPSIKSAGQVLIEESRQAIDALKGCVTPIFDVNEKGEAELLGSAILIELAEATFLCTARHVIAANAASTLYIDAPTGLEIVAGDFYSSDKHDIAVLKLLPEQMGLFQKYSPLRADDIGNQVQAEACKYVEFIGFPASKNRKVYQRNEIAGLLHSNGCTVIEITPARVRVSFNRKRNIDAKTRQRVTAPDPHGMSGGAMFGVPMNAATLGGKPQPKLIGVSTDCPDPNEVFGTNISVVMAVIRDAYNIALPVRLNPANIQKAP
jgi:hypothetical protein